MGICCIIQGTQTRLCDNLEGELGWKVGGWFKREWTYVYLWLIYVDVTYLWQGLPVFSEMTFRNSLSFYIESMYSYLPKGKGMNNSCDPVSPR